jgi:hypothetical protein
MISGQKARVHGLRILASQAKDFMANLLRRHKV